MVNEAEILNKINNLIQIGTISEVKSNKALARVDLMGRVTDFLPVLSQSNTFKKHYIPARVGEQVVVLAPFGEASGGVILRGVYNKQTKEPSANTTQDIQEYEDGTKVTYDSNARELKIEASNKINIICKSATVTANSVDITATTSNTGDVTINGNLTVSQLITGQGGLAISGGSGASVSGNINLTGEISDSKGNLTSHTHNDSDGGVLNAR